MKSSINLTHLKVDFLTKKEVKESKYNYFICIEEYSKRIRKCKEESNNKLEQFKKEIYNLLENKDYIICKFCGTIAYGNGECHCKKSFKTKENWIFAIDLFKRELKEKIEELK